MRLLFKVDNIFHINGRGLVIVADDFVEDTKIRIGDNIQIRGFGDRSINVLVAGIEFVKVERGPCRMGIVLHKDVKRQDIPVEAEVWV